MKKIALVAVVAIVSIIVGLAGGYIFATSQRSTGGRPVFALDGTVHVPAFDLPPSRYASKEYNGVMRLRALMVMGPPVPKGSIADVRQGLEKLLGSQVKDMEDRYPARVVEDRIAGVAVRIVTPQDGKFAADRILINVHGGGFMMCADACALLESIPIAAVGGFKVVSVNYREAPEHVFPAASQDVAAVYQALLKSYEPGHIGLYGCSAGGALSAQVAAWLPAHGLPQLGAIGIFGAGGVPFETGDSAYVAGYIDGSFAPPGKSGKAPPLVPGARSYFAGADMSDPLISPALHPDVLAKFPPTLVITGTRAMDMSPAVYTHSQLVKAGVPGDLIVGEGLGHCFIYFAKFPEAQDAYRTITGFFHEHLN
jgi:epsilon-lactone hydrolase